MRRNRVINFEMIFDKSEIRDYTSQYNVDYDTPMENLVPKVKERGYLKASELLELSDWKLSTGRNTHNIKKNEKESRDFVEDFPRLALSAKTELGGCKSSLGQNYLPMAESTGYVTIYPLPRVIDITQENRGKYAVTTEQIDETGQVIQTKKLPRPLYFSQQVLSVRRS